jgi:hypothetical protein
MKIPNKKTPGGLFSMKCFSRTWIFAALCACGLMAQTGGMYIQQGDSLRKGPGGPVTGFLAAGTRVEVLEKRPGWVRIEAAGWFQDRSLTPDSTAVAGFKMRASHILTASEEEANQVMRKLKSGSAFESLAAEYSKDPSSAARGGDLGEFQRGDFVPAFEQAVLRLRPGQTSDVVKTPLGFHIIKRTR